MNLFKNHSLWTLLIGGALLTTTACKKEDAVVTPTPTPTDDRVVINQSISANTTWTADHKYIIYGFVEVESGSTLTIEPGTVIFGDKDTKGTLIVNRGAKLEAVGTASAPIVFTSAQPAGGRAPGDWGGIILCGKAPINLGATAVVEGGVEAVFGGTDPADNSGTLQYVRIEFPGIAFQPNNEINGLTLAGVGSGTRIDHVQVSYSGDDSYEFFGGNVNVKNLVAYIGLDDDFDMDNGYSGKFQFGVALRDPNQADGSGSNGFEHDNDGSGSDNSPFTAPVISNVSIFGPLATSSTPYDEVNYKRATHLRRNTHSRIFNSLFAGYPVGLFIDGTAAEANAMNGDLKVKNCVYSGMATLTAVASGSTWDISTWFNSNGNTSIADNITLGVRDGFNLTSPDLTLTTGSPLEAGASFSETELSDPFFNNVTFKGAFGTENWTNGWCNWHPQNTAY
jgi:hypothetical protein